MNAENADVNIDADAVNIGHATLKKEYESRSQHEGYTAELGKDSIGISMNRDESKAREVLEDDQGIFSIYVPVVNPDKFSESLDRIKQAFAEDKRKRPP